MYNDEDESPANKDLRLFRLAAADILSRYGWYMVFLTICLILLIQYLSERRASQGSQDSYDETQSDPALIVRRQEAREASRRRLQEDLLDAKGQKAESDMDEDPPVNGS